MCLGAQVHGKGDIQGEGNVWAHCSRRKKGQQTGKGGVGIEKASQAEETQQGQEIWTAWCDQKLGISRVGRPSRDCWAETGEAERNLIKEWLLCQVMSWTWCFRISISQHWLHVTTIWRSFKYTHACRHIYPNYTPGPHPVNLMRLWGGASTEVFSDPPWDFEVQPGWELPLLSAPSGLHGKNMERDKTGDRKAS